MSTPEQRIAGWLAAIDMDRARGINHPSHPTGHTADLLYLLAEVDCLRAEVKIYTQIGVDVGALLAKAIEERNAAEAEVASLRAQVAARDAQIEALTPPRRMWHVVAYDPETVEQTHSGSTESWAAAEELAATLHGHGWLIQVRDPNGRVVKAHRSPAAIRTAIACPTGEHTGTVCTHPRAEGATE